jgi:hypothetical protein
MSRSFQIIFALFFASMIAFWGCQEAEKPTITESDYESILYETELIFALHTQFMDTTYTNALLDTVWSKYGTSRDEFLRNHALYERDVQNQIRRVGRVSERLGLELQDLEQKQYNLREEERLQLRRDAGID